MSVDVLEATDRLDTVTLQALNDEAQLLTRVDRKYIVDVDDLPDLFASRPDSWAVLEIDGRRRFGYESVYFDTPALDSYHLTAHRRRRRFKVRSRLYRDSGLCFLEVKVKGSRGRTVKHRIEYDSDDRWRIADDVLGRVDELTGRDGVARELRPFLVTEYERITLLDRATGSRATVDTDLRCTDIHGDTVRLDDHAIVESKSAGGTSSLDKWLWRHRTRPQKVSKFCVGAAALHPELPSNKWHRVLVDFFGRGERVTSRTEVRLPTTEQ